MRRYYKRGIDISVFIASIRSDKLHFSKKLKIHAFLKYFFAVGNLSFQRSFEAGSGVIVFATYVPCIVKEDKLCSRGNYYLELGFLKIRDRRKRVLSVQLTFCRKRGQKVYILVTQKSRPQHNNE